MTGVCAIVLFLISLRDENGNPFPSGFTCVYLHEDEGWESSEWLTVGTKIDFDPFASSPSLEYTDRFAIMRTGTTLNFEAEPGRPAIIATGRHAADVAELSFNQGDNVRTRRADGHFGIWIVCSESFAPYRIEARDSSGQVVAFLEEPLERFR